MSSGHSKPFEKPAVSILIPTYDRPPSLAECLHSLAKQSYNDFEVVVLAGGSTNRTEQVVRKFRRSLRIRLLKLEGGLVPRMNVGYRISRGDIVVRIDDDIQADPHWLEEIVRTFERDPRVGGVTGPTLIPSERIAYRDVFTFVRERPKNEFMQIIRAIYWSVLMEGRPFDIGHIFRSGAWAVGSNFPSCLRLPNPVRVDTLEACNMALRKNLVESVGELDDAYIGVAEWSEIDLCFRIRRLGYQLIFNPNAIVHHRVSLAGPYAQRSFAHDRMLNQIYFYASHIKANTPDKAVRFALYLAFLSGYWLYKYRLTRSIGYLTGLTGTLRGLIIHGGLLFI